MVNLGEDILKWLFGTVSNTDLVNLQYRLQTNAQTNEAIVHSIQDQATTVSENLRRTELNTKILEELHETLEHLDEHFFNSSVGFTQSMNTMNLLNIAFLRVRRHIEDIQFQVENIALGLSTLSLGRLPFELFTSKHFLHVLREIAKAIPEPWNFVIPADPDDVWLLYQNIKVLNATTINDKSKKKFEVIPPHPDLRKNTSIRSVQCLQYTYIQCERQPWPTIRKSTRARRYLEQPTKICRVYHAKISKMYRYRTSKNLPDYQSFQQSTNDPIMRNVAIQERRKQKRIMSSSSDAMERIL